MRLPLLRASWGQVRAWRAGQGRTVFHILQCCEATVNVGCCFSTPPRLWSLRA